MDQAALDALGFIRPKALGELIDSMFRSIIDSSWEEVLEIVQRVQRSKVTVGVKQSPSASPRAPSPTPTAPAAAAPAPAAPAAQAVPAPVVATPAAALAAQDVCTACPPTSAEVAVLPREEVAAVSPTPTASADVEPPLETVSPPSALASSETELPMTASLEV